MGKYLYCRICGLKFPELTKEGLCGLCNKIEKDKENKKRGNITKWL